MANKTIKFRAERLRALTTAAAKQKAVAAKIVPQVQETMNDYMDEKIEELRHAYPFDNLDYYPGSKYFRTRTLKKGWEKTEARETASQVRGSIRNSVPYTAKVMGDNFGNGQLGLHSDHGWKTAKDIIAKQAEYTQHIRKTVRELLKNS